MSGTHLAAVEFDRVALCGGPFKFTDRILDTIRATGSSTHFIQVQDTIGVRFSPSDTEFDIITFIIRAIIESGCAHPGNTREVAATCSGEIAVEGVINIQRHHGTLIAGGCWRNILHYRDDEIADGSISAVVGHDVPDRVITNGQVIGKSEYCHGIGRPRIVSREGGERTIQPSANTVIIGPVGRQRRHP